ncbi:glycosyltransferase [Lichenicoccus roseus]|uniref:Glycosyl transferase n=1 Tax=Lichenicoccus roseus TaxID=2683649 RepID=A0A5R9J278_9PROT|nr:glycosyltransferase [Lichenicoccus roseus]TLU71740.1 glycosyl transferase [Lichenicoccus roseus]
MIPPRLHFCWIGGQLPWAYVFAILSAIERSDLPEIILHHTDALEDGPQRDALLAQKQLRMDRVDVVQLLSGTGARLGLGTELVELYQRLATPVARSDVLRAAILHAQGGIYLDLDTVTVASLRPLITGSQFLGSELIVWPRAARTSKSPLVLSRHLALDLVRKACRRLPHGWSLFRRVERYYHRSVNNAVMGAAAGSQLMTSYLVAMVRLSRERQLQRYGLGPHLLRDVAAGFQGDGIVIHRPPVFYPLAPEISEHWFRIVPRVRLGEVLTPETRVAHWYASVRTRAMVERISPSYVQRNRHRQLYSAMVCANIARLRQAA